jgi:hypothetical protein
MGAAPMDDVPIDDPQPSQTMSRSGGSDKQAQASVVPKTDSPDLFKGENPLQYALFGYHMTQYAMYLCMFFGIFAIIWSKPFKYKCEVDGKLINAKYIDGTVEAASAASATIFFPLCDGKYESSLIGYDGIGSIYVIYSMFLFVVNNRSWGEQSPSHSYSLSTSTVVSNLSTPFFIPLLPARYITLCT